VHEEGNLERKHEWESSDRKSTARAWNSLFIVLHGGFLYVYKDQKHAKQAPSGYYHNEYPVDLHGASAAHANDYAKRPNVFRLMLSNGAQYLFQARDLESMNRWVSRINEAVTNLGPFTEASAQQRSRTLPSSAAGPSSPQHGSAQRAESKSRADKKAALSFTLGKKPKEK